MPTVSRAALFTLYSVVFVDFVQLSFVFPLLPKIVTTVFDGGPLQIAILGSVTALGEAVASPWLGSLADKFGRRYVLLLSGFGCGIASVCVSLAPTYETFLAARFIAGLCGSSMGVACAFVADSTNEEERPRYLNYATAALFMGITLGPFLGSLIDHVTNYKVACFTVTALCFLNVLQIFIFLPESPRAVEPEIQTPAGICMNCLFPCGGLPAKAFLVGCAGFFAGAGFASFECAVVLYFTDTMFAGDVDAATMFNARLASAVGILGMISTLVVYPQLMDRLQLRMHIARALNLTILSGMVLAGASFVFMGMTMNKWAFAAANLVMMVGDNLSSPSINAMLTSVVAPTQYGRAMGMFALCGNLARAIGPFMIGPMYQLGGREQGWVFWHAACWFLNAIFKVLALACCMAVCLKPPVEDKTDGGEVPAADAVPSMNLIRISSDQRLAKGLGAYVHQGVPVPINPHLASWAAEKLSHSLPSDFTASPQPLARAEANNDVMTTPKQQNFTPKQTNLSHTVG